MYYISDLHLEHQLKEVLERDGCSFEDISTALNQKIAEMVSTVNDTSGYLLVFNSLLDCRDTQETVLSSHSLPLTPTFFRAYRSVTR